MPDTPTSPLLPDLGDALVRPAPPRTWRERVEHLADATGSTPARVLLGGLVAVLAIGLALWLTRPAPTPPEVALPFASTVAGGAPSKGSTGASGVATSSTTAPIEELVVDVEGAVAQPGIHRLRAGARITDAIAAAGGLGPGADGARLNLAALVQDGERVYVPAVGEEPPPLVGTASGGGGPGGARSGPVDLNRADVAALDALPGVGPATAAAIVEHRNRIGRFTSVDQLMDVRGIGRAKLDQLRPLVTV